MPNLVDIQTKQEQAPEFQLAAAYDYGGGASCARPSLRLHVLAAEVR
jgi:hypothetical protein